MLTVTIIAIFVKALKLTYLRYTMYLFFLLCCYHRCREMVFFPHFLSNLGTNESAILLLPRLTEHSGEIHNI